MLQVKNPDIDSWLQEAWHQCSFSLLPIIQTPVVIDHVIQVPDFISDILEAFFLLTTEWYFQWNVLKENGIFFFYKKANISYMT